MSLPRALAGQCEIFGKVGPRPTLESRGADELRLELLERTPDCDDLAERQPYGREPRERWVIPAHAHILGGRPVGRQSLFRSCS